MLLPIDTTQAELRVPTKDNPNTKLQGWIDSFKERYRKLKPGMFYVRLVADSATDGGARVLIWKVSGRDNKDVPNL